MRLNAPRPFSGPTRQPGNHDRSHPLNREVWITGVGAITGLGPTARHLSEGLRGERSAVTDDATLEGMPVARAPALLPVPVTTATQLDRCGSLFFSAAAEAWESAALDEQPKDADRFGVVEGSSLGHISDLLAEHRAMMEGRACAHVDPESVVKFMTGAGGSQFALLHGIRGPVMSVSAGSVSGTCAIGEAIHTVMRGEQEVIVAGGAESPLAWEVVEAFRRSGVLADGAKPGARSRPFDQDRRGMLLGEGAAAVVIESADHARARGARCRAVPRGFVFVTDPRFMTGSNPNGDGISTAMSRLLREREPLTIDWIVAHGTGTPTNDAAEVRALHLVFDGDLARLPVTALKPAVGHCLGASGAIEAVAAILAMEEHFIPAVLNTRALDPALPVFDLVTHVREAEMRTALLLSESFGGRAAALAIQAA
ncbi:MAG TPA: beta-ketoacyl synthase N-terminal-like domain-containing protein [Candidatus Eisenbacteria bacterium]|nr:beta-ketoacyl synthase N-terminal-like domain-containing protein [Candidatus Eisenbacteria bacterium]